MPVYLHEFLFEVLTIDSWCKLRWTRRLRPATLGVAGKKTQGTHHVIYDKSVY